MRAALGGWIDTLEDDQFVAIIRLVGADTQWWAWMKPATQVRVVEILQKHPVEALAKAGAFDALSISELQPHLLDRFQALDNDEKQAVIAENPRPEFADEAITLFGKAGSFRSAESLAEKVILPMAQHFSGEQVSRILSVANGNAQIWHAGGMPSIFESIFDATLPVLTETLDDWKRFLRSMAEKNSTHEYFQYTGIKDKMRRAGHPMDS